MKKQQPRFNYACAHCGGSVTKKPAGPDGKGKWIGLGGWRCSDKCGPTEVVRKLNQEKENG
jgi:hypothetical protein